jgi:hypothetical protein
VTNPKRGFLLHDSNRRKKLESKKGSNLQDYGRADLITARSYQNFPPNERITIKPSNVKNYKSFNVGDPACRKRTRQRILVKGNFPKSRNINIQQILNLTRGSFIACDPNARKRQHS